MSEMFNYRSVLAPYMRSLIEVKASAGISALRMKWILKEFDDFAVSVNLTDPHVTSEFISRWRKTRDADCDRTIYAKYSAWRQLTTLMSRRGWVAQAAATELYSVYLHEIPNCRHLCSM